MKRIRRLKKVKPHARYDFEEKGFRCLICEEGGYKKWAYYPWEIPRHLKEIHKIDRKQQYIADWSKEFQKEYLKNKKRPMVYEFEPIPVDTTPPEKYEEERKRRLMEAKARREGIS